MPEHAMNPYVHHQFEDAGQQRLTYTLGMWVFLATEVLFFGGMFTLYAAYRTAYPQAFHDASRLLDVVWGTVNTGVLLLSSLTMALSVYFAEEEKGRGKTILLLLATAALGAIFLGIKAYEYHHKVQEHLWPGADFAFPDPAHQRTAQLFFALYFVMTGIHALHLLIGIVVVSFIALMRWSGRYGPGRTEPVELTGLYWHFVDIIWIFLFPLLYLIGRS